MNHILKFKQFETTEQFEKWQQSHLDRHNKIWIMSTLPVLIELVQNQELKITKSKTCYGVHVVYHIQKTNT